MKAPPETPMDEHALRDMRQSQERGDPVFNAKRVKLAQRIAGLGGWIATSCRPDAYFAFVVLTQYLGTGLTQVAWDALLRRAAYLAHTPHLKLTYRAASTGTDWEVFVDSSLFNAGGAGSYGGYCARFPGSGIFAWKSFVPRKLGLSSGAAETIMAAHAVQYIYGQRMISKELQRPLRGPTRLYTDSLAALQGTEMENVPVTDRYNTARRAVLRQAKELAVVELLPVATAANISDMFTKPLPRDSFFKLRALVLGLEDPVR